MSFRGKTGVVRSWRVWRALRKSMEGGDWELGGGWEVKKSAVGGTGCWEGQRDIGV